MRCWECVGRCWEVLGGVGRCWEVLGSVPLQGVHARADRFEYCAPKRNKKGIMYSIKCVARRYTGIRDKAP